MNKILITCMLAGAVLSAAAQAPTLEPLFRVDMDMGSWTSAALVFTADGNAIMRPEPERGVIRYWDAWNGERVKDVAVLAIIGSAGLGGPATTLSGDALALHPDGNVIAVRVGDSVFFIDPERGSTALCGSVGPVSDILEGAFFNAAGNILVTGGHSGRTLKVWDVNGGSLLAKIDKGINYLALQPESGRIAYVGWDDTVRIVDTWATPIASFEGNGPLAFSPDGKLLAFRTPGSGIQLYSPDIGQVVQTLKWVLIPRRLAFSPDGGQLAIAYDDQNVRVWDVETGAYLQTLQEFEDGIVSLAYSPDGSRLGVATWQQVSVWPADFSVKRATVQSSSRQYSSTGEFDYGPKMAFDGDRKTTWCEGVVGDGIGETMTVLLSGEIVVDEIRVMPGYFDARYWADNNRVKRLSVRTERQTFDLPCPNEMSIQRFAFQEPLHFERITFEIAEVYRGDKWQDTCLSEMQFYHRGERIEFQIVE